MEHPIRHIAIIPDGNRRWAKQKGLPAVSGHKTAFEETLPSLVEKAANIGVKYFTFWALSTENLVKRSKNEIDALFTLGKLFYKKRLTEFKQKGIRILFIGDTYSLPKDIQEIIRNTVETTKNGETITLIIAINYGGRDELIRALQKVVSINHLASSVNKNNFEQFLDTKGIPDPDLIIRTGGEKRLSGFMPWQSIYSELYFTDLFFPDFSPEELEKAVVNFAERKRNFGK